MLTLGCLGTGVLEHLVREGTVDDPGGLDVLELFLLFLGHTLRVLVSILLVVTLVNVEGDYGSLEGTGTELGLHVTHDLEVVGDDGVHSIFDGETLVLETVGEGTVVSTTVTSQNLVD